VLYTLEVWCTYVYDRILDELQIPQQTPVPVSPSLADEPELSARLAPQISTPSPRASFPSSYQIKHRNCDLFTICLSIILCTNKIYISVPVTHGDRRIRRKCASGPLWISSCKASSRCSSASATSCMVGVFRAPSLSCQKL